MSHALVYDPAWMGDAPVSGGPGPIQEGDLARGEWPRQLVLDEEAKMRLSLWLDDETHKFFAEREELLRQWQKWQTQYWAEPAEKVKNFPFNKAANIVIPMTAIAVEAVHARLMNTLFSVEPFWSIRPRSKEWIPAAKPVERYLQTEVESNETLNAYSFCSQSLLELIKLGTAVGKSGYRREFKKSLRGPENAEEEFFVETYNGATLERVPLTNFMLRFGETDPQDAGWVGEKHKTTWGVLKRMAQSGRMDPEAVEKIRNYWVDHQNSDDDSTSEDLELTVEKLSKTEPLWREEFHFYEIWCSFDVDGDGWDEEIVIDYHKPSQTFLSIRYNWYSDLHRPYHLTTYVDVEGIWPGIGIGKQNEQFQEEITTIHRQRLDNATLANMAQIIIRKNTGYGPGEPIFPGKMWFVDDVASDIAPFKLSEVYPSSYANEESVIRHSEKRTGVNETILGLPQTGTPGTATGDLARLAEGNKRFDLVMKNVKRWLGALGVDILSNYQQFGNQQMHWIIQGEDGQWVEQVFRMPPKLVRRGAVVELTVTDSITNQEVEQQQWLALFQVVTNYYQQVLQLAQILGDEELFRSIAQRALAASDEALRRLLETFSITDADRFALAQETGQDASGVDTGGSTPGTAGIAGAGSSRLGFSAGLEGSTNGAGQPGGGGFALNPPIR